MKYVLAFAIFAIAITFFGESSLINRMSQKKEIDKLSTEIEEQQQKFKHDKETLNSLKNDPEALKRVARERYYMKAEDEDIFVIEDEEQ
jgi:cell division protein FtsB